MKRWQKVCLLATLAALVTGCKDVVNPHSTPQGDPSTLVASMAAATNQVMGGTQGGQVVLTLNNAPAADQPLEQDFITELVELFEKRNPNIKIQYSPWQYSPESFFERLGNRTLTDVVEVDAAQMAPIIEANAAADLTENVKVTPEMGMMNPDVFTVTSKDGRTFGVPVELHTLALFYNRKLLDASRIVVPAPSKDKARGKGAEGEPRDWALANLQELPAEPAKEIAQYGSPYYYPPGYQAPQRQSGRGSRESQGSPQNQGRGRQQQQQQQSYQQQQQYYQQQQQYYQQYQNYYNQQGQPGYTQQPQQEDARARRAKLRKKKTDDEDSQTSSGKRGEEASEVTVTDDTLTSEAEVALSEQNTTATDSVTSVIKTADLPRDLDQFIRLAVRLTDHSKGVAGYGPVLFAAEGGREYAQWAALSGMSLQTLSPESVVLHVDQSGDVASYIKDLHWKFDVTPNPEKCYYDNLMNMFVAGKLGMMILPADGNTVAELIRRGMKLDGIGITALPKGAVTRDHLTYGKCLIINSQLDRARRAAAFKWLMFMASPEVHRLRAQFFHREREMTAAPAVPLYSTQMQQEYYESIKPYRSLPLWADYEDGIASHLKLEPAFQTERFYEAIAVGLRPVVDNKDSDPYAAVKVMTTPFEKKYIIGEKPADLLDQFVLMITKKRPN